MIALYAQVNDVTPMWQEIHNVSFTDGRYSVLLTPRREPIELFHSGASANPKISDERQKRRRHPPERSRRANEQHDINLDE